MEILITISVFITLVIIGSFLNKYIPRIPAALFQIILGFLVSYLAIPLHFEFESEAFMAMIIAPLLFTDAYKASRSELWLYKKPIVYMAVGLVITTVVVVGYFINYIIPSISLGAAFALAAILSPTDAVAVKSITKGMKLPKGLMSILEGESLLNDAAGIVSFKIALASIITGTFSLSRSSREFFITAIGGMILGVLIGLIIVSIKLVNRKYLNTEPSILVIIQVILPVATYFIAEEFHLSGIIAVVFAGILLNFERYLRQGDSLDNQAVVSISYNQDTISYVLNGFVFVLLGYLLPGIFRNMITYPDLDVQTAMFYVILITIALIITRFTFVYIFYVSFQQHTFKTSHNIVEFLKTRQLDVGNYSRFEYALVTSLCGIHGTVTLATALMIPLTIGTAGEPFPLRNAILFIGSGVVLLSMIIGTIFLPLIIKTEDEEIEHKNNARSKVLNEVINELQEKYYNKLNTNSERMGYAIAIKKLQEQQIYFCNNRKELIKYIKDLSKLVRKAEQEKVNELLAKYDNNRFLKRVFEVRDWRIRKLVTYSVYKQLFITLRLSSLERTFKRLLVVLNLIREAESDKNSNLYGKRLQKRLKENEKIRVQVQSFSKDMAEIIDTLTYNAMDILEEQRTKENSLSVDFLKNIYDNFDYTLYNVPSDSYIEESREFETEAIQMQKDRFKALKLEQKIEHSEADKILRDLNYNEALLYSNIEE
ncbi:cation:proton antiporter [Gemella sanguinis]|jgi:sodium, potassium, lithium and rubidium/H(+) antiporter|uniref:Sodium:proton antiporter n=1 Tax=Gemella sanguinis TaxID=84135 RepID=A0A2N6SFZ7_9BACL|nr:sodium:proton antiporter [Gemella sanguinis]EGF89131.1 Na+/H+ antiporter [Gemella sanguinis M325]NKZ25223.1 sodium:proton antiporter [Gemella sanguinis]PMC52851.1 sodium:proton antiporter [Gemella sanguinis]QGS07874.1 sodium:proton antiporter [Gemella sanguinis]